jgi:peptidoglycan/LPS O-acetylase OafA/YrhL
MQRHLDAHEHSALVEQDSSTTKRSLSIDQVTYLNIIRALAAELVLFGHGFLYFRKDVNTHISLGGLGVVMFFLISGFLISRSVFTNLRRGNYILTDYMIERFSRVYTAAIPALLLIAIIDYFLLAKPRFPDTKNYTLWNAFGYLAMLDGFPPFLVLQHVGWESNWFFERFSSARTFWTLPIEWWIYVAFGILFFSIRTRTWTINRFVVLGLVSVFPLYHFIARFGGCLTGVWMIGLGSSALYCWVEDARIDQSLDRLWILRATVILIFLAIPMGLIRLAYADANVYDATFTVLLAVIILAPLFILQLRPISVTRVIRASAHRMASYSYSLYLIHSTFMIAILTLHREWVSGTINFILMLVGINIAALCFAHVFELRYHLVAKHLKTLFNRRVSNREAPSKAASELTVDRL